MWLERPVWMMRYWVSSWLLSASLAVMPNRRYAADVRAALTMLNVRVTDEVLSKRST